MVATWIGDVRNIHYHGRFFVRFFAQAGAGFGREGIKDGDLNCVRGIMKKSFESRCFATWVVSSDGRRRVRANLGEGVGTNRFRVNCEWFYYSVVPLTCGGKGGEAA